MEEKHKHWSATRIALDAQFRFWDRTTKNMMITKTGTLYHFIRVLNDTISTTNCT